MKKLVVLAVLVMVVLCCQSNAAQAQAWKLATIRPAGTSIDNDVKAFIEDVRTKSNGRINIEIYPNSQLGDYTVVQERIGVGSVEMSCQTISATVDRQLEFLNMPYLVKDWNGIRKNFRMGTPFANWVAERLERQNIKLLAIWPAYFGGVAMAKEPPSPGDPSVKKNLKVRVVPTKSFELLGESQGYLATPLPLSETFTALQTGIVDGVLGAGAEGYYANFRDVIKFYIAQNTHVEAWPLIINLELFESLSDEDQKVLTDAAAAFEERRFAVAEEDTAINEKKLEDYGVKVIHLTPEELAKCAEAGRKLIVPTMRELFGEKTYDSVINLLQE